MMDRADVIDRCPYFLRNVSKIVLLPTGGSISDFAFKRRRCQLRDLVEFLDRATFGGVVSLYCFRFGRKENITSPL